MLYGSLAVPFLNQEKAGRRAEGEFFTALDAVLEEAPDVTVLHEGPSGSRRQRGNTFVRNRIEGGPANLVVCGHVHWDEPLAQLADQVVNVDSRGVIPTR